MPRCRKALWAAIFGIAIFAVAVSGLPVPVVAGSGAAVAQTPETPPIAPESRTVNLTQEQRFIIREYVKELQVTKAPNDAPDAIGDPVPPNIELHPLPVELGQKVPQARSHLFFLKDGEIILVSASDRRIAEVIR